MYNLVTGEERQITTEPSNQQNPAIYDDIIVWQDNRNYKGDRGHNELTTAIFTSLQSTSSSEIWDIYMYNISTEEEQRITSHVSNQISPAIYEDKIVWMDYRNWNWDIYMYDLSSGEEIQVTTDESAQMTPAIQDNNITWLDNRNVFNTGAGNHILPEIYMYDISSAEEVQITDWTNSGFSEYPVFFSNLRGSPVIYGNRIVWSDERHGMDNPQIFMFSVGEQTTHIPQEPIEKPTANPAEEIEDLQDYISDLEGVDKGTKTSLAANLNNAIIMVGKDDEKSIERLEKLIDNIENQLLPKGRLSNEQAEYIVSELERIITLMQNTEIVVTPNSTEGKEMQINSSGNAHQPAIYGNIIVWEDTSVLGRDIYLYDVKLEEKVQISTSGLASSPAIHGDRVVWLDMSNTTKTLLSGTTQYIYSGNKYIYLYNISTGKETQITFNESIISTPAIYGDKIVWHENRTCKSDIFSEPCRGGDIYMYDILTGQEKQITTSDRAFSPAIYGNTIVWVENGTIYMYDIPTEEMKKVSADGTVIFSGPAIYEDKIVWSDMRDYPHSPGVSFTEIYMYNISSGEESRVTTSGSAKYNPAIYEDIVVWADGYMVMSGEKIHACNVTTGEIFRLSLNESAYTQQYPAIYGDKVVWMGDSIENPQRNIFISTLEWHALINSQEIIDESIDNLANTTGGLTVENTSLEMVQNSTDNSSQEFDTEEYIINESTVENVTDKAYEELIREVTNTTGESSEESTDEIVENTSNEASHELSEYSNEEVSDESIEDTTDEVSEENTELSEEATDEVTNETIDER